MSMNTERLLWSCTRNSVVDANGGGTATLSRLLGEKLTLEPPSNSTGSSQNAEKAIDSKKNESLRPSIHMDAMAFGMGCCCLQITFQAKDVDESRFMYDQLAVVAPIMMAHSASTPILKGRLTDTDCRWGIISESCDDRTPRGKDEFIKADMIVSAASFTKEATKMEIELRTGY